MLWSQRDPISVLRAPVSPPETLDSLRSRVEQQRLAVQANTSRMEALKSSGTVFQPLPEGAVCNGTLQSQLVSLLIGAQWSNR